MKKDMKEEIERERAEMQPEYGRVEEYK